jgi:membrane protease YdiL (CAAX protease family)
VGRHPWGSFFAPGALVAALVVAGLADGWSGMRDIGRRLIRWRVGWVWYVLAVAVPLGVHALAVALNVGAGASGPALEFLVSPLYALPLALGMHIVSPMGGPLMEEPSFRGYAQPELQRTRSRLGATAVLALAISGWHAPLFIMSEFSAHPIGFVTTVAVTFWYAWLFNRASGSSLLTLIAHGVEGGVLVSSIWSGGPDLERLNWTYAISWCLVAFVLLLVDRRYWVGRSSEATTPPPADRLESAATTAGGAVT